MNDQPDMIEATEPNSSQLNADDLNAGPRTITITGVRRGETKEQPIAISFDGDHGKPWLPSKGMRRVIMHVWGIDTASYVGRSVTLWRDPEVTFGKFKVGGIRITHMSHITVAKMMPLTVSRAKREPYTVQPLADKPKPAQTQPAPDEPPPHEKFLALVGIAPDLAALSKLQQQLGKREAAMGEHYQECALAVADKQRAMMAAHPSDTDEDEAEGPHEGRDEDPRQEELIG